MSKVRDLGINSIPDGLFAACADNTNCPGQGQSQCPNHSAQMPCQLCTETGRCEPGSDTIPPKDRKPQKFTRAAIAQLQYQLQQKIAGNARLTI